MKTPANPVKSHESEVLRRWWTVAKTGNHQGLIVEGNTGRNIAVSYDKADAPLIAAAPGLLEASKALMEEMKSRFDYVEATPEEEAAFCKMEAAINEATTVLNL